MKRLFTYISMLTLAVACETVMTPIASDMKKADGVDITVTETKDESVTFTLAPKAESAYYSYLVEEANEPSELDAESVYSEAYKTAEGVVKTGSFKWTNETATAVVTVKNLAPNTTYQVYAVAATPMGFVGEVCNASFKTSDTVAPELVDYEAEDNVVTLIFNESVIRGEGALTAGVYAMNSAEIETGVAVGSVTVAEENIVVAGNNVTVTVAGLPAGAFYAVNFPEGAFKDPSNNKAAALESAVAYGQDTGWEPAYSGVGGRNATQEWVFEDLPEGLTDWTAPVALIPTSEYGLGYIYKADLQATYYESASKTIAFTLAYNKGYGISEGNLIAILPEEPSKGSKVVISVPAEAFEDYFGNLNAEWEGEMTALYDMNVPFENVVGTFVMTETSAYDGQPYQYLMILEESDNPIKGNVMMTAYMSNYCKIGETATPIYGCYDPDQKTLTFASQQIFMATEISGTQYYLMFASAVLNGNQLSVGTAPVVFTLSDDGLITNCNYYYGVYAVTTAGKGAGFIDAYYNVTTTPYVPEPETSAISSKNLKFATGALKVVL
jgi:hypothetical protein